MAELTEDAAPTSSNADADAADADEKAPASAEPTEEKSAASTTASQKKPRFWSLLAAGLMVGLIGGSVGGFFAGRTNLFGLIAPPGKQQKVVLNAWTPRAEWTVRKGPDHAKVTIVEFTDFQCPFCARVHPVLKEVLETHDGTVAVEVRNFPLPMHKRAEPAGRAFQAAARQGKAMEMADLLYANMKALGDEELFKYAEQAGLDLAKFKADFEDPAIAAEVAKDIQAGKDGGVNGTPALFVNGRRYMGQRTPEGFKAIIEEEAKKADELLKKGTPIESVHETLAKQAVSENPKP